MEEGNGMILPKNQQQGIALRQLRVGDAAHLIETLKRQKL